MTHTNIYIPKKTIYLGVKIPQEVVYNKKKYKVTGIDPRSGSLETIYRKNSHGFSKGFQDQLGFTVTELQIEALPKLYKKIDLSNDRYIYIFEYEYHGIYLYSSKFTIITLSDKPYQSDWVLHDTPSSINHTLWEEVEYDISDRTIVMIHIN